jgi:subtilisin family serine protease
MKQLVVTIMATIALPSLAPALGWQEAAVSLEHHHRQNVRDLAADPQQPWDQHSLLVRWREELGLAQRDALRLQVGAGLLRRYECVPDLEWVHVRGDLTEALTILSKHAQYVEPNHVVRVDQIPNDPQFNQLYGLLNTGQQVGTLAGLQGADIRAADAWSITTGDPAQVIAIIDTGVDLSHPDLAANAWTHPGEIPNNGLDDDGNGFIDDLHGWDFFDNDNDPHDTHGHGTHVAGTIGAVGDNGIGVTGVNWSCRLMPLRFIGPQGGFTADAIAALDYCLQEGVLLSNNSWSGSGPSQALKDAISAGQASGHIFVAASGNSGLNIDATPQYPASFDLANLVSVGATDARDELGLFSNWGPVGVDLVAPGVDILSTAPGGGYQLLTGTSMAAPQVTGVLALMRSQLPGLSWQAAIDRLRSTSRPLQELIGVVGTGGVVNAHAALLPIGGADGIAPSVPTGLSALPLGLDVRLSWNPIGDNDLSGYRILRSDLPLGPSVLLVEGLILDTEFTDPNGIYDSTVYYQVQAEDTSGNRSAVSSQLEVLVGGVAGRQALISETFNDGFFGPDWLQGNAQASVVVNLGLHGTPAALFQRSTWIEREVDTSGFGNLRLDWARTTSFYDHGEEFRVSWSPDGGATWNLLQARGNSPWTQDQIGLGPAANNKPELRLRFETTADGMGECTLLDDIHLTGVPLVNFGQDHTPPRKPRGLAITGTLGAISMQWWASIEPDLAGYCVFRQGPGTSTPVLISPSLMSGTVFQDTTAFSHGTYRYSVRAIDLAGNASELSDSVESTTVPPADATAPKAPENLTGTPGHRRINLTWTAVTAANVAGYRVFRWTGSAWVPIQSGLITDTFAADTGLINDVTYSHVVVAVDQSGSSSLHSSMTMTTPVNPGPMEIFTDGFEAGTFIGWIPADSSADVVQGNTNSGQYAAELRRDTWIQRTIPTLGFESLVLEFSSHVINYGPGEELIIEYFDGSSWTLLDTITNTSWQARTFNLGSATNDNVNFALRFMTNADSGADLAYIDDVIVIGTQI